MYSIGPVPHHFPHWIHHPSQFQNQAGSAGESGSLTQIEKMTLFRSQETDLTIVTKEGDYVTISADSDFQLEFNTYDRTGQMTGGTSRLHYEALSLDSRQEFSVSVKGDLSEQETKDILKVLQSMDGFMNDLQSGRLDQAVTRTDRFGNLGSLSSIDATLQVEQGLSLESATMTKTASALDKSGNG